MGFASKIANRVKGSLKTKIGKAVGIGAGVVGAAALGYGAYKLLKGKKKRTSSTARVISKVRKVRARIALIRAQRTLNKELSRI